MLPDDADRQFLEQARDRAGRLLDAVSRDGDALRSAASDAAYADGAAVCDEVAEAARQLLAHLDAQIGQLPDPATQGPQS